MRSPRRMQLSRAAGWRKPAEAVVVSRPTRWGNPFVVGATIPIGGRRVLVEDRATAVELYRKWLDGRIDVPSEVERRDRILRELPALHGRDLLCWCPLDGPCHADVLLERANA